MLASGGREFVVWVTEWALGWPFKVRFPSREVKALDGGWVSTMWEV